MAKASKKKTATPNPDDITTEAVASHVDKIETAGIAGVRVYQISSLGKNVGVWNLQIWGAKRANTPMLSTATLNHDHMVQLRDALNTLLGESAPEPGVCSECGTPCVECEP